MLGHIQEWFLGWIAGIRPDPAAPGFARFVIAPEPVGDLTWARGSYDSVRGRIESAWERNEARFRLRLKVPPNTRATVLLPTSEVGSARESGRELTEAPGVSRVREKAGRVMLEVAAGEYDFVVGLQH
ncbi:MAG: hypothetical protein M5U12_25215 [Verrucomicrobia bacterium]|nr:hypothetical protein [Verrucomicrobiota bacterium]